MDATTQNIPPNKAKVELARHNINLSKSERTLSLVVGSACFGLGLMQPSRIRSLLLSGVGAAIAYRGVTGHCHLYEALGITTRQRPTDEEAPPADDRVQNETTSPQYAAKNQVDKDRFDKLKATQVDRGRDEAKAIDIAAEEVKELRRREGRSKDDNDVEIEKFDNLEPRK